MTRVRQTADERPMVLAEYGAEAGSERPLADVFAGQSPPLSGLFRLADSLLGR